MYSSHFDAGRFYENDFLEYIASKNISGLYLDVGANIGNHSLFFSFFTQATQVIAFEPVPVYQKLTQTTIDLNEIGDTCTLIKKAASDFSGPFELTFNGRTYDVDAITLDELDLGTVALMKIDVEGMEPHVIKGAKRTIGESRPIIYAEASSGQVGEETDSALLELGYARTGRVFNATPTYEYAYSNTI